MRSKLSFFRFLPVIPFLCLLAIGLSHTATAKVSATIILASVEGEVKALSLDEDLELILDESSVGKSVDENFILTTGKNGKAVFLFSNGVLVTLKPNTRLYIRTFVQESFSSKNLPLPGELEEEPSTSHLKIHLDTGDLVVKAPRLKRGSSLKLTSPLGTAQIRGTMFQIVVARDPDTGTVSGGVNLISGDIDFTDVSGDVSILASGQGLEVSTGKLGDSSGGVSGELRDLSAKFGPVLAGTGTFPPIVAPPDAVTLPPEGVVAPEAPAPTVGYLPREDGWGSIHDIATDTFFEIEEAEFSVSSVTFDAIESSVSVDTPTPALTAPTVPAAISGGDMAPPDPFFGGAPKVALKGLEVLRWELGIPFVDPGFTATDFSGADIAPSTKLANLPDVYVKGTSKLIYASNDFRGFEGSATRTVDVVATPPTITLNPGSEPGPDGIDPTGEVVYHKVKSRNPLFSDSVPFRDPGFTAATASTSNPDFAGQPLTDMVQVEGLSAISYEEETEDKPFYITYTVNDQIYRKPHVSTTVRREVHIADLTPPKVFLNGSLSVQIEAATSYIDAGATAQDNYDSESSLLGKILVSNADPASPLVNLDEEGEYSVMYNVTDVAGNVSDTVSRLVTVVDTTPPEIALFGSPIIFVDFNSTYRDPGAYATDTRAGDLTFPFDGVKGIEVDDPVAAMFPDLSNPLNPIYPDPDKKKIGTYTVTYTVSDGAKTPNVSTINRTVIVLGNDGQGPQMRLFPPTEENGTKHLIVNVGETYNDPGAYAFKGLGTGDVKYYKVTRLNDPDMSKLGQTDIHYLSYDEFGNEMRISRIVEVQDLSAPVVYPNKSDGQTDLSLEAGVPYRDDGFTAIDNYQRDFTVSPASSVTNFYRIIDGQRTEPELNTQEVSDMQTVGFVDPDPAKGYAEYRVVYIVSDGSKNSPDGDANRTLMVYDTTAPVGEMLAVTSESSFVFASDGDKTFKVVGDNSKVVFPEDPDWGSTGSKVEAKLKASESPDYGRTEVVALGFRLLKDTGESFDDPGVKFSDNAKGLDEDAITVEHTELAPDAGVDKQYRITYKARDAFGNLSMVYERIIKVLSGPRVTLLGESEIVVVNKYNQTESLDYAGTAYTDQGATAKDALDNVITNSTFGNGINGITLSYSFVHLHSLPPQPLLNVAEEPVPGITFLAAKNSLSSKIDLEKTGKYEIFYKASDENFNQSPDPQISRIVYSVADDGVSPTVTPRRGTRSGDAWEVTLDVNATGSGTYVELGATARKTRHLGLGFPYEVSQSWDENNASAIGAVAPVGNVPFVFGKGVGTAVEDSLNPDLSPKFPYEVAYSITDEFGNPGTATLKVRMQDLIKPSIVSDAFAGGGTDSLTIDANESYVDPGFTVSDNYYANSDLTAKIEYYSQTSGSTPIRSIANYTNDGSDTAHDKTKVETWDLTNFGKFYVRYTLTDPSGNTADFNRTITVIDTTGPIMTLIGPDGATSTDANPLILPQNVTGASSSYNEYGVNVTDNSVVGSQYFPGSGTLSSIKVEIDDSNVNMDVPGQYKVTYTATDSSGNENDPEVGDFERTVLILDKEKPLLVASVSAATSDFDATSNPFVVAEGGVQYDDDSGQTVKLWNGDDYNTTTPQALTLSANDAQDGVITSKISRTIDGRIIKNNDVASVPSLIDTSFSSLDVVYEIRYDVNDTADPSITGDTENAADPLYRRIIVKDTLAPSIQPSSFASTVVIDYRSLANPDASDPADVRQFMVNGLSAVDANNFDPGLTWVVDFQKTDSSGRGIPGTSYVVGEIFPETRNNHGPGYKITVKVSDSSGNISAEVVRYLKVGDLTPPTLTMMGKSEIHDFFRFGQNTNANLAQGENTPFLDRPSNESTIVDGKVTVQGNNPNYDATGFAGGAHRMMLAEYSFTDPGVYAEDENADWALLKGYPDLNGNGVGESYAMKKVRDRLDMDTCSQGGVPVPGVIHVYSFMEDVPPKTIKYWQGKMKEGVFGYSTSLLADGIISPAKVPDVKGDDPTVPGEGFDFNSSNKITDLTNFDMTQITIEYRVRDHWDNFSAIATRLVYFYESRQFGNFAFYATPISDASNSDFEDYSNNDGIGPFLSDARKDSDGDGVSDFWEFTLGSDYKNPTDTPVMTADATFQNDLTPTPLTESIIIPSPE